MLQEGATKLLCLEAGGAATFICEMRWNILTRGSADSKTPQREEEWGREGEQDFSKKWERDKKMTGIEICYAGEMAVTK